MVDIQSPTAKIKRGKKRKKIDGKKLQDENIYGPLLHRATIKERKIVTTGQKYYGPPIT